MLDDDDPDLLTPVNGHNGVALPVSTVLSSTLQTDGLWTKDATGYNFKHVLDVAQHPAFAVAGQRYLIVYELAAGQPVLVRFRVHAI